jgi:hypothetical protein
LFCPVIKKLLTIPLQKKFNGKIFGLTEPFAKLTLGDDARHNKYGVNTRCYALREKNTKTIDKVYVAEVQSFQSDVFTFRRLFQTIILVPVCRIVGYGGGRISGYEKEWSDLRLSYLRVTRGLDGNYQIERISKLPGDANDYFSAESKDRL